MRITCSRVVRVTSIIGDVDDRDVIVHDDEIARGTTTRYVGCDPATR